MGSDFGPPDHAGMTWSLEIILLTLAIAIRPLAALLEAVKIIAERYARGRRAPGAEAIVFEARSRCRDFLLLGFEDVPELHGDGQPPIQKRLPEGDAGRVNRRSLALRGNRRAGEPAVDLYPATLAKAEGLVEANGPVVART